MAAVSSGLCLSACCLAKQPLQAACHDAYLQSFKAGASLRGRTTTQQASNQETVNPCDVSLNGCLGSTERGGWRGVGRKGWKRVGERLAKGWRKVGEGLAKGWKLEQGWRRVSKGLADFLAPPILQFSRHPFRRLGYTLWLHGLRRVLTRGNVENQREVLLHKVFLRPPSGHGRPRQKRMYFPALRAMGWKLLGREVRPDIRPDVRGISRPKALCLGCFSVLKTKGFSNSERALQKVLRTLRRCLVVGFT